MATDLEFIKVRDLCVGELKQVLSKYGCDLSVWTDNLNLTVWLANRCGGRGFNIGSCLGKLDSPAINLVNGAYDIVQLWKPSSPAQEQWKKEWLEQARSVGAGSDD